MSIGLFKVNMVVLFLTSFLISISIMGERYTWQPEWKRKLLHLGLGLTSLTFPWVFSESWQVVLVCSIVLAVLLSIRTIPLLRNSLGKTLYDVDRASLGELLFVLSIVLLFEFSGDNTILYIVPITILTLSDAFAAHVGINFGKRRFAVIGGTKSWEGTLAFAGITWVILFVFISMLTDLSWLSIVMIATLFSIMGAIIEAVSWHGFDNVFIPLAAYLFLYTFLSQDEIVLFYELCILISLVTFAFIAGENSQLGIHALMTAIISAYFFWVVGGLAWLLAMLLLFFAHMILVKIHADEGHYTMEAVFSVTSGGFFWLFVAQLYHTPLAYFLFAVSLAIHLQIMILLRLRSHREVRAGPYLVLLISLISCSLMLSPAWLYYGLTLRIFVLSLFTLLVMIIGGITMGIESNRFSTERWIRQGAFALAGSAAVLLPIELMVLT